LSPPSIPPSTGSIHNESGVVALSIRETASLPLSTRDSPFSKIVDFVIEVLETRLLYPIQDTAAALSNVYAAYSSKTNEIEAKYPPLRRFNLALGPGYLIVT